MLSEEEKEAIEWLKRLVKLNKRDNLDDTFAEILLNLIEKQSKEIEELKQNIHLKEVYVLKTNDYIKGTNDADELCNKKWENKIKAKIEEVKEIKNEHSKSFNWEDWKDEEVYTEIEFWLQSLLEKE